MQFGADGYIAGTQSTGSFAELGVNAYLDSGSVEKYINTNFASKYRQLSGIHSWYTAASGTAGNTITFTQSLAVGKGTTLALEGATSASGTGIAFPATQSASSDANTLDDYEEGTWTPSLGGNTTYTWQIGRYTKTGRFIFLYFDFSVATLGTGGTTTVSGVPFVTANINANAAMMGLVSYFSSLATNAVWLGCYISNNSSAITFTGSTGTASATTTLNGFAVFGNSARVTGTICYETNT
jgi:hypothetical protein